MISGDQAYKKAQKTVVKKVTKVVTAKPRKLGRTKTVNISTKMAI